jgi:hypothetical protein
MIVSCPRFSFSFFHHPPPSQQFGPYKIKIGISEDFMNI